jgi:hypothetical protein
MFTIEQAERTSERAVEVFKEVQPGFRSAVNLSGMTYCAYCGQRATTTIVSCPEKVCFEHALEFWTGLLVYARDVSEDAKASHLRVAAIAAVGPSPGDHANFSIRLAS